jgi:ribonucleoside-diphosphate reductase subunit M2
MSSSVAQTSSSANDEPFLIGRQNRFVIYPIEYEDIWQMYKKSLASFWVTEEIDLHRDVDDFQKLSENEKYFILNILAFFSSSDGIVMNNISKRFSEDIQNIPEAVFFYTIQGAIEAIHSETYSLLIDTYVSDAQEKSRLFNAVQTIPAIKKKAEWALKWTNDDESNFAIRLVAFACVEGIQFSSSFCSIFLMKERGVLPGLCFSNELISRDESLHTDFAVLLYSKLTKRLDESKIHDMIKECVDIEKEFITESIPCSLLGMNCDLMCQYIEFIADRLVTQLGYEKIWNSTNPFDFMERISMSNKTNFFEARVSEYSKARVNVSGENDTEKMRFTTDADF